MYFNGEPLVFRMATAKRSFQRSARAVLPAAALAAAALSACAHLPGRPFVPPTADVASPLAADINRMNLKAAAYPSFINVPTPPTDVRPVTAWTRNIYDVLRARREMQAMVVLMPQSLYGAEAFAQDARAYATPPAPSVEPTAQASKSTTFAEQGRERAKPPSPTP